MTERAAPFYCPYCGEEDIRPNGQHHGQWACGACLRVWTLRYLGLGRAGMEPKPSADDLATPDDPPGPAGQRGTDAAAPANVEVTR